MEKIEKVWFAGNRIYVQTADGFEKSRPLEAFPRLMDATDQQRDDFYVWADGESIRWEEIDEDIHVSSFDETNEPDYDNDVAKMLDSEGVIDIGAFAELIGMKKFKLDLFRYGIWTPSEESLQKIRNGLHRIKNDNTCRTSMSSNSDDVLEVVDVDYLGDYRLRLAFNNGETRIVDLDKHLVGPVFGPLREHKMFVQFGLTHTLEWVNGADLAPEFLYEIGTPIIE